ncbi:hypothetical protein P280DRAFT_14070 [Massarina eburnea CBS 473.64]|uniref:Uncharacterized protein n=1 Tax=Massarina eburnea CBS 473.64 TaxID=1395130 RepID=A0A6A6SJK1_9PLEO|nr:hypothetical protein P280DRAFT_14070 [Massarina eburnea CBS 473.64]
MGSAPSSSHLPTYPPTYVRSVCEVDVMQLVGAGSLRYALPPPTVFSVWSLDSLSLSLSFSLGLAVVVVAVGVVRGAQTDDARLASTVAMGETHRLQARRLRELPRATA